VATAYESLGLDRPAAPVRPDRPLYIDRTKYLAVALWPSNSAIVSTATTPEEEGIHLHAWNFDDEQVLDVSIPPLGGHLV
jgi:hypothetical protein